MHELNLHCEFGETGELKSTRLRGLGYGRTEWDSRTLSKDDRELAAISAGGRRRWN